MRDSMSSHLLSTRIMIKTECMGQRNLRIINTLTIEETIDNLKKENLTTNPKVLPNRKAL